MSYSKFNSTVSSTDIEEWKKIFDHIKTDPDFSVMKIFRHEPIKKCDKCPQDKKQKPFQIDPNCKCGEPLWICLQPGQHLHPCPVHPSYVIHGSSVLL